MAGGDTWAIEFPSFGAGLYMSREGAEGSRELLGCDMTSRPMEVPLSEAETWGEAGPQ